MNATESSAPDLNAAQWRMIDAEQRVNLIRTAAITGFYLIHLWYVSAPRLGIVAQSFFGVAADHSVSPATHIGVSIVCLAWLLQAFAVHFLVAQRSVSDRLSLIVTLGDLFWLTALLSLSTGPAGPMVGGYFLIIILTGLRFNLRLVRIATVGTVIAYVVLLGITRWPVGLLAEIGLQPVPRYHQLMMIVAFVFAGVGIGQIVRHGYVLADSIQANDRLD